ncbi:MAG: hypothetical protein WAV32_05815 [Halobacteriota archaeon]
MHQIPRLSLLRITPDATSQEAILSSVLKHYQKFPKLMDPAPVP